MDSVDHMEAQDDEEELAMQQPAVHDVHVSTETGPAAGTSGRDAAPSATRFVCESVQQQQECFE